MVENEKIVIQTYAYTIIFYYCQTIFELFHSPSLPRLVDLSHTDLNCFTYICQGGRLSILVGLSHWLVQHDYYIEIVVIRPENVQSLPQNCCFI